MISPLMHPMQMHSHPYPHIHPYAYPSAPYHYFGPIPSTEVEPNDNWAIVSDVAERRRIQNRIAQRRYRQKLKRRLADLERRATSRDASQDQFTEELNQQKSNISALQSPLRTPSPTSSSGFGNRSPRHLRPVGLYTSAEEQVYSFDEHIMRRPAPSPSPSTLSYGSEPTPESRVDNSYYRTHNYLTVDGRQGTISTTRQQDLPSIQSSPSERILPNASQRRDDYYSDHGLMPPFEKKDAVEFGQDMQSKQCSCRSKPEGLLADHLSSKSANDFDLTTMEGYNANYPQYITYLDFEGEDPKKL